MVTIAISIIGRLDSVELVEEPVLFTAVDNDCVDETVDEGEKVVVEEPLANEIIELTHIRKTLPHSIWCTKFPES